MRRMSLAFAVSIMLLSGLVMAVPPTPVAAQERVCFTETGQCIAGRFLAYWQAHGGLALNGYPLSGERRELLEDGQEYTVQYFERVRMEYHPENQPPWDVLLGQFGRRMLRTGDDTFIGASAMAPLPPAPGTVYFPETGHNLGGGFLAYWQAHGGLAQFGYPLTEEIRTQYLGESRNQEYTVQYFERARFEWHPENPAPYDILLGQFGRRILADAELLAGVPSFNALYVRTAQVQERLGRPVAPASQAPGAYQGFERGVMLWRGDTRGISVLCGGTVEVGDQGLGFNDTWREGQDPGGGPGPRPGLYEPKRGFGKVWRENPEVRACLGYATSPDETGYTLEEQWFSGPYGGRPFGRMFSAATPEGRFIYAQYRQYQAAAYQRYPDPLR